MNDLLKGALLFFAMVGCFILLFLSTGCADDAPERDFFLLAKKTGHAYFPVLSPEEIKGFYHVEYLGETVPSPLPSPSAPVPVQ